MTTSIETHTGIYFDYISPRPEQVRIEDIARALSTTCRYGGHVKRFYSVAEHALLTRRYVIDAGHPELGFAALHHDDHEAYLGDVPSPLKRLLGARFDTLADLADGAIAAAFGIHRAELAAAEVKAADLKALFAEARVLKASKGVGPHWGTISAAIPPPWEIGMQPAQAENDFLFAHYRELRKRPAHIYRETTNA